MSNLSQRTLTFLIKDKQVLLGFKKTGFGKGNYLGIGGKVEEGESNEEAACREVQEEIRVQSLKLEKAANLKFLFPEKTDWSQEVHIYITKTWDIEPSETEEIRPEWVNFNDLPLTKMWDDAKFWLLPVLNDHRLRGNFTFDNDLKVIKVELSETTFDNEK